FHSQQAAEKAIKALLVLLNTPFPRTHDLERLQLLLPDDLQAKAAADLPELTDWVIDGRYPADRPEASHAEAVRALALARDVVTKAREDFLQLSRRPPMPGITATLVNQLRAKTGQAMMECKKMLTEAEGDIEEAIDMFRKKGVKASLTERAASEGRIAGAASPDGKSAALVEINCNTDFTAKSEPVQKLA